MNTRLAFGLALAAATLMAGCGQSVPAAPSVASSSPAAKPASASQAPAPSKPAKPAAASGSAVAKPAASQAGSKIVVGYPAGSAVQAPLFLAEAQGFFTQAGLNVGISPVKSTAQMAALEGGELQIASVGGTELVNADLGGAHAVMVGVASDYPVFSLYADASIKAIEGMVGKEIGMSGAGSSSDTTAKLFLKHYGLQGQVKIVPTGADATAIYAALTKHLVAGAILSPPSNARAAKDGFVELVNGVKLGEPLTHNGFIVERAYLKDHRDTVKAYLGAYQKAWTFTANPANRSTVEAIIAKYAKATPELAKVAYDYLDPIWTGKKVPTVDPKGIANAMSVSTNPKVKDAKPEDFIDNSLLQQ